MRPSLRARRQGCSRDVTHAASCVAGVLTPPAASASSMHPGQCLFGDSRREFTHRGGQGVLGDAQGPAQDARPRRGS